MDDIGAFFKKGFPEGFSPDLKQVEQEIMRDAKSMGATFPSISE